MASFDDRRNRQSRQSDSNLSSAFEGFSRSLDNHTKALNKFADDFDKTISKLTRELESTPGRTSGSGRGRDVESTLEDIHRDLDRSGKATASGLTALQKTGKSLETVITNVGSLIVSEIRTAYTTISNSYQSHLSSITAQMQISNKGYTQLYNEASEYFRREGLSKQFSPVDFVEALEDVLSTGLRGESAQEIAYQNLVTNKLLPAISTNTVAYRRMSKVFGEEFNKNTLAFSKYAESILGAEGMAEGRYDAMLDTLYADMMYAAEGDTKKANEMDNMLKTILSHMESNLNMDGNAFVDMLYQGSTGQIGEDPISQYLFGIFDQEGLKEALRSPEKLAEVYEKYVRVLSQHAGNPNTMQAFSAATGMDQTQSKLASAYVLGGGVVDRLSEEVLGIFNNYDQESMYNDLMEDFKDGWTQTADDALTKQEENLMTWSATAASSIARFDEALNTVTDTLVSLAGIWLLSGTAKGLTGGVSSGGKGLLSSISTFGGATSAGAGLLNLLAGPGALVAGGGMMIADSISTGVENRHLGAGLLAALTGDSNIGLTEEQKLAKASKTVNKGWVDENSGIDWKQVGSNALKGTALGTGVGTAAGGWALGLGTAVGAGVGAILGSAASIIDQTMESAKYNKLAKASKELEESLSRLKSAQEDYESTVSTNNETLKVLNEWSSLDAEQKSEIFTYLQDQYPTILGNLSSENDLDSRYIEILKTKIERENALLGKENLDAASGVFEDLKKEQESLLKAVDGYKSQASLDFVNSVLSTGGENGTTWSSSDINAKLNELSKLYGISKEDLISELNSGESGSIIKEHHDSKGNFTGYTLTGQSGGGITVGDNIRQFADDYATESQSQQKKAQEYIDSQISAMLEAYGSIEDIYLQYYDSKTKKLVEGFGEGATAETKISLDRTMTEFETAIRDIKEIGESYGLAGLVKNRLINAFPEIATVWGAFERDVPKFKVGLNTVPYDNYLASLHEGEMVLTSEDASKLRSTASRGSGLSRVLSIVESLSKVRFDNPISSDLTGYVDKTTTSVVSSFEEVNSLLENSIREFKTPTPVGTLVTESSESLNFSPVVEAISAQTETVVEVLNSILDTVSRLTGTPSARTSIPRSVISFEGV